MNRRASLATILGKRRSTEKSLMGTGRGQVLSGLEPYSGPWGMEQAGHLLRRATFGSTYAQIKAAAQNGLETTLQQLLADAPLPDPPVNFNFGNDPNVAIGETWIDAPYPIANLPQAKNARNQSLAGWQMRLLYEEGVSLREKMTLFWHNHFVTSDVNDPKFVYRYITTLRSQALGNYRQLVKDITIDPAMLRFLNGNQNSKFAPNENYARELLELFSIGKGPQVGPGDYTNYTEDDVKEMARVLTGWRDTGFNDVLGNPVGATFVPNRHDTGEKQLSHRFDNIVIQNAGENEYSNLIDIIFQKDEAARYICRKLYRWFVYYEIDAETEANVIQPMAQILIANDYEVKPALEALFRSEHFFDLLQMGCVIKNPLDFIFSTLRQTEVEVPTDLAPNYLLFGALYNLSVGMQMQYYQPPEVAGWKAYYQEPVYYRYWINSVTLPLRMSYTDLLVWVGANIGNDKVQVDVLALVASLDDPLNPNAVVEEFASIFFPQPITESQKVYLKNALIPGLPDFEWTEEYTAYLSDPGNELLKAAVELKLRNLMRTMLVMPEFYLC